MPSPHPSPPNSEGEPTEEIILTPIEPTPAPEPDVGSPEVPEPTYAPYPKPTPVPEVGVPETPEFEEATPEPMSADSYDSDDDGGVEACEDPAEAYEQVRAWRLACRRSACGAGMCG